MSYCLVLSDNGMSTADWSTREEEPKRAGTDVDDGHRIGVEGDLHCISKLSK